MRKPAAAAPPVQFCPFCTQSTACWVHRGNPSALLDVVVGRLKRTGAVALAEFLAVGTTRALETLFPQAMYAAIADLPTEDLEVKLGVLIRKPAWDRKDLAHLAGCFLALIAIDRANDLVADDDDNDTRTS